MNKILTLIIPTYNMEKYLDKCLTSLIIDDQELLKQLEVLVIIDGATDRSSEIAHGYEAKWPETFRVIDKENGNYGSCVNRGLKEATGKYIKVLDADDWFDTELFERYLRKLQKLKADVDLVLNDMHSVTPGSDEHTLYNLASFYEENKIHQFKELLNIDIARYMAMHCIAYKTENVRAINYHQTEGISYTDVEWFIIPMRTVKTFVSFHGYLYNYLLGREGQTVDPEVQKRSLGQLSKMLLTLVRSWEEYVEHDSYYEYMKKEMEDHVYILYCNMSSKEIFKNIIKPFDDSLKKLAPRMSNEMEDWSVMWIDNSIRYVNIVRNPWTELFYCLKNKGYKRFIINLDYMSINKMLHPIWIVSLLYLTIRLLRMVKNCG